MLGTEATFLWYNLAAIHSAAPTTATKKDHWNPADNRSVMLIPGKKGIDNVLVVEPINGTLRLNTI